MTEKAFTLTIEEDLLEQAQAYAARHSTTMTELVITYLRTLLGTESIRPEDTPILHKLAGILPSHVSEESYRDYLADKHES